MRFRVSTAFATFVGIDVAKDHFDFTWLPQGSARTLRYDANGLLQLRECLRPLGPCLIVVEATGGYERRLIATLVDSGFAVALVNPRQVRDYARGIGRLAKTDRIDAAVLARFAQEVQPHPLTKTLEKERELDELVGRRRQLLDLQTAESNRRETTTGKLTRQSIDRVLKVLADQIERVDAAIAALIESDDAQRHNPSLRRFAERLTKAGKRFKVVITACMRKLLVLLNVMVKTHTPWNPEIAR